MQVQVIDGLAAPLSMIGHDPIALLDQSLLRGNRPRRKQQFSSNHGIVVVQITGGRDVLSWNDQNV